MDKNTARVVLSAVALFIGIVMFVLGAFFGFPFFGLIGIIVISTTYRNVAAYVKNRSGAQQPDNPARKPTRDSELARRIFEEFKSPAAERRNAEDYSGDTDTFYKSKPAAYYDETAYTRPGSRPPWEIEDKRSGAAVKVIVIAVILCAIALLVIVGSVAIPLDVQAVEGKI